MSIVLIEDKLLTSTEFLKMPKGISIPVNFVFEDEFIICYNSDGKVASLYKDEVWDFSAYSGATTVNYSRIHWGILGSYPVILDQVKKIVLSFKYYTSNLLSAQEVISVALYFRQIGRMLGERGLDFYSRKDSEYLNVLTECIENAPSIVSNMIVKERNIKKLEHRTDALKISFLSSKNYGLFCKVSNKWLKDYKKNKGTQTTVIPSRIYSQLIVKNEQFIDEFILIKDAFFKIADKYFSIEGYGQTLTTQKNFLKKKHINGEIQLKLSDRRQAGVVNYDWREVEFQPTFEEEVRKYNIVGFLDKWGYKSNRVININKILNDLQFNTYIYLLLFTGARQGELRHLPYDCIEKFTFDDTYTYVINGVTSKLAGEITHASWVVGSNASKFISVAQEIADLVIKGDDISDVDYNRFPLFPAFLKITKRNRSSIHPMFDYANQTSMLEFDKCSFIILKNITIRTDDLLELMEIDPSYGYLEDSKFNVGNKWPYASHQFRRSLVVYAFKHGINHVDLKWQLKHILLKMTLWYGRNGAFAKAIVKEDDHVFHEFNKAIKEHKSSDYLKNVLGDDSKKAAPYGNFINQIASNKSYDETLRLVKRGESQYKETPLGGCVANECSMQSYMVLTDCINCKSFIATIKDLKKLNRAQQHLIQIQRNYEEGTHYYNINKKQIDEIEKIKIELNNE